MFSVILKNTEKVKEGKEKMDNEKNISITFKQQEDTSDEVVLSLGTLSKQIKKYLFLWIVISVFTGAVISGGVLAFKGNISTSKITALVGFNYSGIESGLAPDGSEFDVNKIKSPNIIESALTNMDEPLSYVENVRRNISIKGVIPNDALDKISLYQSVYSKGGSAALDAVNSLLEIGYYPSYYVITFDYDSAGVELNKGKKILDGILESYQDYFFKTYGFNKALGNSVVTVDYKDYDYPAAVDVFNETLDDLDLYIKELQRNDNTNFRSNVTGYSFNDLRATIDTIKSADLSSLSSFITINNITNDKEHLITYYEYRIEQLERELNVNETKLESITNSINEYEKDKLLVFGINDENTETSYTQASEKYDDLIEEKLDVQDSVSRIKQNISYVKDRLSALNENNSKKSEDIENVEQRLEEIYNKILNLIDLVNKTSDEYYENIVFAEAYNILVPATGEEPKVEIGNFVLPLLIFEGLIFIVFAAIIIFSSISIDSSKRKNKDNETEQSESTAGK